MEKPYHICLEDENDNATALDDLLMCAERANEGVWNFKSDPLPPEGSCLDSIVEGENEESISESLGEVGYLRDVYAKQELLETKSSCSGSFTFDKIEYGIDPRPQRRHEGNGSSSDARSTTIDQYGTEDRSAYVSGLSGRPNISEGHTGHHSDSGRPLKNSGDGLEERIRCMQTSFDTGPHETQRPGNLSPDTPKEVQKPPTTAGIGLEDLKAVFHLERPKAEKKLRLKRTTFSNLSRHYGISKWPFRTIRDAMNRMQANNRALLNKSVSRERRRKLSDQQRLLAGVIKLIYEDPRESRDSNTLAVLLRIVTAKESYSKFS